MFPGIILQLTYWYRADEMTIRFLIFCKSSHLPDIVRMSLLTRPRFFRILRQCR